MSAYGLQKLIHHVNRDPELRALYQADAEKFAERYELSAEEREAVLDVDIRKLYTCGVHPLLLRPFTLLHGVSPKDYSKALAGLE